MSVGRKLLLSCIALIVLIAAIECVASAVLFRFYSHKGTGFYPRGTASAFLVKKTLNLLPRPTFSTDNRDMFKADPEFGYRFNPGVYHIVETSAEGGLHSFKVTIGQDGYRAAGVLQNPGTPRIFLIGDSMVWGFGIDDEMTVAWMLQSQAPEFHVQNLAVTGYTMVQSLLQFRALEDQLTPNDIVIFPYTSYDLHYNVGDTPGPFGHDFEVALSKIPDFGKLQLPFAYLSPSGAIGIRHLQVDCGAHLATCAAGPDEIVDGMKVTEAILTEVMNSHRGRLIVTFGEGTDDDPVIQFLRSHEVPVADIRFPKTVVDKDDYLPAHDHVGAFAHHAKFEQLLQSLQASGLVPTHRPGHGEAEQSNQSATVR